MTAIEKYELILKPNGYDVIVYLDRGLTEFSDELGRDSGAREELSSFVRRQIKEKFPGLKIFSVKVMVGSLLVSTLYMGSERVFAAETAYATQTYEADMYTVKAGDSLSLIAKNFNITVTELKAVNQLTTDYIIVGQELRLPFYTYQVAQGDSLYIIAKKFNVSVDSIKAYNKLTTDLVLVGQRLKIPINIGIEEKTETITAPATFEYTIVAGDSLSVIAKRYVTTVETIKTLNKLTSDQIYVGQILIIPKPTEEQTTVPLQPTEETSLVYTVIAGDSLSVIAKRYNTSVETIKTVNKLATEIIYVGQKLVIPQEMPITEPTPPPVEQTPIEQIETITYNVVAGDSLSVIAKRFGTTVDSIMVANQLTSDRIFVGQMLTIPQKSVTEEVPIEINAPTFSYFEPIHRLNKTTYLLQGKADTGSTVFITLTDEANQTKTIEVTPGNNGSFQQPVDLTELTDGEVTISAYSVYPHGQKSEVIQTTIIKDTNISPPHVDPNVKFINGESQHDVKIVGSSEERATVSIVISDEAGKSVSTETVALENGDFIIGMDVSELADSVLTVQVTQTDLVGNKSDQTTFEIVKDTVSPDSPVIETNRYINNQNQTEFLFKGIAEANSELELLIQGTNIEKIITATTLSTGEFQIPLNLEEFADGDVIFTLTQKDEAGNISKSTQLTRVKNTSSPNLELGETPVIYNKNQNDYQLTGKTAPNSEIEITFSDGSRELLSSVTSDETGAFSVIVDVSLLTDGEITSTLDIIDSYGNKGEQKQFFIDKDTKAPEELHLDELLAINTENELSYELTGRSSDPDGLVYIEVTDGITFIFNEVALTAGTFHSSMDFSSLIDGDIQVAVYQQDKAGNKNEAIHFTVEKDTEVIEPIITRSGYIVEGDQTFFNIVGSGEPHSTVHVTIQDAAGTSLRTVSTIVDADGFFNIDINVNELNQGINFLLTTEDKAGNISEEVIPGSFSHSVVAGDSLWQIAKRYNTTIAGIKAVNRLTSDTIFVGQTLQLPITASTNINLGYVYFGDPKGFTNQVLQTGRSLNTVAPSYFDIHSDGSLKLTYQVDPNFVNNMHNMGIRVVPFLSNHWDRDLGRAMIANPEKAAQEIYDAIMKYNLDGINVDIENINHHDRQQFTLFVKTLREKLPASKEVSVAVAANPNGWTEGWHGAYDYRELAKYADYLMIMAYDESYYSGPEGPVASFPWVERSVQYALAQGVPSEKTVIGMAHFGRYWIEGKELGGYGLSNTQVQEMLSKYKHEVIYDEVSQSVKAIVTIEEGDPKMYSHGSPLPIGTYTVWYENEQSIQEKTKLVHQYNLKGIGHWSIGQENTSIWAHYPTWTTPQSIQSVTATETETVTYQNHTVVSGDSLFKIANQYGTTVAAIKEANHLSNDTIYIGQVLKIGV